MNRIEHLLMQIAEECAEIAQRASKAARFGLEEIQPDVVENPSQRNNGDRIIIEFVDLCATLSLLGLFTPDMFDLQAYIDAVQKKHVKIEVYLVLAKERGTLQP